MNGNWSQEKGSELYGKNIGLLGFGNIGQKLASLLQPFKCKILFFDDKKFSKEEISDISSKFNFEPNFINQMSLKQVLKESDILSIHLPLTASTENIISLDELNELRSNVCIINTCLLYTSDAADE